MWYAGREAVAAEAHVVAIRDGDGAHIECDAAGGACNVVSTKFDGVDLQGKAIVSGADAVALNAAMWAALGDPAKAFA